MKNIRYPLLAAWTGLVSFCFVPLTPLVAAEGEKSVVVTIGDEKSSINGVEFLLAPSLKDVIELLGPPDRIKKLANDIRIWDDLGIVAYSAPGTTEIDSLTFTMTKQDQELTAKRVFSGQINLPMGPINRNSKMEDLKKLGFTPNASLEKFYELELLAASFLLEFDAESGSLMAVSVEFGL